MNDNKIPRAIRQATLKIGDTELGCAVLEDGTRVLTQKTFLQAIGRSRPRGGEAEKATIGGLPIFLASPSLISFISEDLRRSANPVLFRPLKGGGRQTEAGGKGGRGYGLGFKAPLLPEVCKVFVEARDKGELSQAQMRIAEKCDRLLRGLAGVGIIALIDEATGFQYERDRDALRKILEAYINPELLPWTKRFPEDYFKELFRLRGWTYEPSLRGPRYVGKLTNALVYEKLPPGVLDELRRRNPPDQKGQRRHRHHQFLTPDIGNPHLANQLVAVTTLMRAAPNWTVFERMFNRAFPARQAELPLIEHDENSPS
ncbi:MAG TPA: P63C domain-containing protein [Candidatus Binataceae bacterium]